MGIGNTKDYGNKESNYNWQKRMLALASSCCTPVLTTAERLAWTAGLGKLAFDSDLDQLYVMKSGGWTLVV